MGKNSGYWKRSRVGNEWQRLYYRDFGKVFADANIQKYGKEYYVQIVLAEGGLLSGRTDNLAEAKQFANEQVQKKIKQAGSPADSLSIRKESGAP